MSISSGQLRHPPLEAARLLPALLLVLGACSGPDEPIVECTAASDCAPGQVCTDNLCKDDATPACTSDEQCEGDDVCEEGVCVAPECVANDDCTGTDRCEDGECVAPECSVNDDCTGDDICDEGVCVAPQCAVNDDCTPGSHCDDGVCLPGACRDADKNACGGCSALTGSPGDACGVCNKDELSCTTDGEALVCNGNTACDAPTVTTDEVTGITQYAAVLNGTLVDAGDAPVVQHGFCYSESPLPALNEDDSICSNLGVLAEGGFFSEPIGDLELNTTYFVRAYALNDGGVAYGTELSFNTLAAKLPVVTTDSVSSPFIGVVLVEATLEHGGVPAHTGHGICLSLEPEPALGDGKSNCSDLGQADEVGPYERDFINLVLGRTYYVRAFGQSTEGVAYGEELEITLAPSAPVIDTISDALPDAVVLSWHEVANATGYHVYRDGQRITDEPLTELTFEDEEASAGGAPEATGLNPTASGHLVDKVLVSWEAAVVPAGAVHTYTVKAVNGGGESEASAAREGRRGGSPVTAHEVSINGGAWISTTANAYEDLTAPAGHISQANPSASQGESSTAVNLSLSGAEPTAGALVNYRVRAVNAAGKGAESDVFQGQRAAASLTFQWQRSSGTTDGNYTDLPGATEREYADTGAPADGSVRFYRVVISGGPEPITTNGVSGFREVGLPELTTDAPTGISQTGFTITGGVVALGDTPITQHGYCWGTTSTPIYVPAGQNPDCQSFGARDATGKIGPYSPSGLTPGTNYYVRTFAQVTKSGNSLFVAYGPTQNVLTVPATPAAPTASTDIIEHVRLSWQSAPNVTKYEVRRNGTLIATLDANSPTMTYNDTKAPAPPKPAAPTSSNVVGDPDCTGTTISWKPPPAPAAGSSATYTLVAINGSGSSGASAGAVGRRAAAPIQGYKIITEVAYEPIILNDPTATQHFTTLVKAPSITPGTIQASDGSHAGYVRLESLTEPSVGAPPQDTFYVEAFNAMGFGAQLTVMAGRPSGCPVRTQWMLGKRFIVGMIFEDITGAVGSPYDDTAAPDSGAERTYKARYYVEGANTPAFSAYSEADTGHRLAIPPRVSTHDQNTANATTTSFVAVATVSGDGLRRPVPSVQADDAGICITTSGNPTPTTAGALCLLASSDACTYKAGKPTTNRVVSCTFTGLTPNTPHFVQGFARNAVTAPDYVLGGEKIYRTNP